MFDKVSEVAERVATNVSRRAFLGRLGQGALGIAAAIGGALALPARAQAGSAHCCICYSPYYRCYQTSTSCIQDCQKVKCADYPNLCPQ
jgi:hypothetical protein